MREVRALTQPGAVEIDAVQVDAGQVTGIATIGIDEEVLVRLWFPNHQHQRGGSSELIESVRSANPIVLRGPRKKRSS